MPLLEQIDNWHKTKVGLLAFGLVELLLFYVFASFALDSGSLFDYFFTLLFLVGGLMNLSKFVLRTVRRSV